MSCDCGCKKEEVKAEQICGIGEELVEGECRKVAVTLDLDLLP